MAMSEETAAQSNATGSIGRAETWLIRGRPLSQVVAATSQCSIEARVKKLLADPVERQRIARIAAQIGDDFNDRLQAELNAIGLSLFGLRVTLGVCCPARLGEAQIMRIIRYLGLGLPIQGRKEAAEVRLAAVLRSLGSDGDLQIGGTIER